MKTRLWIAIIVVVIGIASVGIYSIISSHLDSYGKSIFCGEDPLMTSLGKCRPGGPISIMDESHDSRLVITVGEPIDYSGLAPITTTQVTTSEQPITKIIDRTYHPTNFGDRQPDGFGTSWDLIPGPLRIDMSIVDQNNTDAIDRDTKSSFGRIQPLYKTSTICDNNQTVEILYGAPVIVPIKDGTHTVFDRNLVDGLLPNKSSEYILSFASFFKQEIKLPDIAVIQSQTSETCNTDIKNHETAYYNRVVFEMENPIQDYVPPVIDFETDKKSYVKNDTILISGFVGGILPYDEMVLQVTEPVQNNIIHMDLIEFEGDEEFTKTIKTDGSLWTQNGTYLIKIQYGRESIMTEQKIVFTVP